MAINENMLSYLNSKVKELENIKKEMEEVAEQTFTNKDIPLQDRWDIFNYMYINKLYDRYESSTVDYKELQDREVEYYDDLLLERYEVLELVDLVCRVDPGFPNVRGGVNVDVLKEQILEKGVTRFKYDW